jgi:hypothetical protein
MSARPVFICASMAALLLGGCASSVNGNYPSLAKRPIEERFAVVETAPLPPPGPAPADVAGKLAQWRADAAAAESAFAAARGAAETAVSAAAGAPVASEAWIAAQQALSRLAVVRGPVVVALADADGLYIARRRDDAVDGLPDIVALRTALTTQIAQQDAVLAALTARLAE